MKDLTYNPEVPVKYERAPGALYSWKMADHANPYSIAATEFNFLHDFIARHNLTRGYECATAFGMSALAAGFGLKKAGGKLVTLDAYIEEKYHDCNAYTDRKEIDAGDPDGLRSLHWPVSEFRLEDIIHPAVGWCLDDVASAIEAGHGSGATADFAFIDAGHWDSAAIADVSAIRPFVDVSKSYAIFFHDLGYFSQALGDVV